MTTPLYKRLKDASPQAVKNIHDAAIGLTMAILAIEDTDTAYDFCVAVDQMLTAIGVDGSAVDDSDKPDGYQPSSVPIYLRLQQSAAHQAIKNFLAALNLNALLIPSGGLRDEYNAAMQSFWTALGIPTVEELQANPGAHPNVHVGALYAAAEHSRQREAEIADLEALFKLDIQEAI